MFARWTISLVLLLISLLLRSQASYRNQEQLDSLWEALDTTTSNRAITSIADRLLQLLDTTNYNRKLYDVYYEKGLSHQNAGDFPRALYSQQAANRIALALQDSFLIAQSRYRIGNIQYNLDLNESARVQYVRAENIFSHLDSLRWVAYVYNAVGILEREENNLPEALKYYQRAFDLLHELGHDELASVPLSNIGDIYLLQKQYQPALRTFNQSLSMRQKGETTGIAIAHLNIGQSWRGLNQFDRALREIRIGLKMAEKNGFRKVESLGLLDLSQTFKKMGRPDSALYYLEAYQSLNDSLQKEENRAQLENLFVAYETEKAQHEATSRQERIILLEKEKRLEYLRNYFIISLLALALIISSAFFIRNRFLRKLAESELRNERLESEQMRRELEGKQKDLTNLALEIARKNEVFTQTNEALSRLQKGELPVEQKKQIRQLIQYNARQLRINEGLEELQINIEQVNADFFDKLSQVAPDLTPSEKQLSALIRLNLSTKDIASIRNISPKSVEMARYRLRKKLPIDAQDDIYAFVQQI